MAHKYIKEIVDLKYTPYGWNEHTGRDEMWQEQRQEYGFDERETWSMDTTFMYWLYERLMMFKEVNIIDLDFHKFNINGKEMTQGECIDTMISKCKEFIMYNGVDDEFEYNLKNEVLEIWKECIHSMWW